ncbi:hypothetical protein S40293_05815 [Stachybotrys chartarum IBT 40293]|nr:hypothetical protein S40293_05815 [Stachybotrys chartarum IBT 40293]
MTHGDDTLTAHRSDSPTGLSASSQDHDAGDLLKFADPSNDLAQLSLPAFTSTDQSPVRFASTPMPTISTTPTITSSSTTTTTITDHTSLPNPATTTLPLRRAESYNHDEQIYTPSSSSTTLQYLPTPTSLTSSPSYVPASSIRKTSPGLAARLKALGFGAAKGASGSLTPQQDPIGRLNEDHLRQLDQRHQAGSFTSIITRRGRPWKGASASPPTGLADVTAHAVAPDAADPPQLPEITASEPLAMDTNKYRLPDHTNGNGTKATLETRREHLERHIILPGPDDIVKPSTSPPPPAPPAKDSPAAPVTPPNEPAAGLGSYFTPTQNRPGSIYTLSRASFANQLAQLTSLQLPDAGSLSSKVSAIPTAQVATSALINAADQIRSWISKASEVIGGLDSEDDVEWAAAGGREGLAEVENAIARFEELIKVFVGAIEQLQAREDIKNVSKGDLNLAVSRMEAIIHEWATIRATLQSVRSQVEIAMEWEELWNNVLGDIQGEMDELIRLVFEMEERRHKSLAAAANGGGDSVDIGDLETIVEDTPPQAAKLQAQSRITMTAFPLSPASPVTPSLSQDDSSLLALFARMQPLRASLDFLPMRLSVFEARAEPAFPTACEELEMRRAGLDANYKKLEKDAESLRKELGEDRWVIVFRGAGRQAQKMHESVERSLLKLKEAIEGGTHLANQPSMAKKLESYEAKKMHYGPAIERVLSIIDKGVKDRLTVNGEILRLHADLQARWESLKKQTAEMDGVVEEIQIDWKSQQLRDSVSSMLSNDRSTIASGRDTPGSSPPSSVIMSSLGFDPHTPVPRSAKSRSPNVGGNGKNLQVTNRRLSALPAPVSALSQRQSSSRLSTINSSSINTPSQLGTSQRPPLTHANRPRWNTSTNTTDIDTGHHFKPLSLTTPSPYAKRTPTTQRSSSSITPSSGSKLPTIRSQLVRAASESPQVEDSPSRPEYSRLSFRERLASPGPYSQQALAKPRLTTQSSMSSLPSNRRSSLQPSKSTLPTDDRPSRPASSLASTSRRTSLLPQPKGKPEAASGRTTPGYSAPTRNSILKTNTTDPKDTKPRWKP